MNITLFLAYYDGDNVARELPRVVDAWDEFQIDENPTGFREAVTQAQANPGVATLRLVQIGIDDETIRELWETPLVEAYLT